MKDSKQILGVILAVGAIVLGGCAQPVPSVIQEPVPEGVTPVEYLVLATTATSTMQEEMNAAANRGFRFMGMMGGKTAGGAEIVVIMSRDPVSNGVSRYEYRLLATNQTSTMQEEMQEAGSAGFQYRGQSVAKTVFGGREIIVAMERMDGSSASYTFQLLATSLTSTMEEELNDAGAQGFDLLGMTVAKTAFGGNEVVSILEQQAGRQFAFRLLATQATGTMQEELSAAAQVGFRFAATMGGETDFGGKEIVAIMSKPSGSPERPCFDYQLLATSRTSTMQQELQEVGQDGFLYRGQTIFEALLGGQETIVITERDCETQSAHYQYVLLATNQTSTMQRELSEAGAVGFRFAGLTVAKTMFGGQELVTVLYR
jgi:hypothetical protein